MQKSCHGQKFGMLVFFVVCLGIIRSYDGKGLVGLGQKLNNSRVVVAIIIQHETVIGEGETAIVKGPARVMSAHPATVAEVM